MFQCSSVRSRPAHDVRRRLPSRPGLPLLLVAVVALGAFPGCGERDGYPAGPEPAARAGTQPAAVVSSTPPGDAADGLPEPAAVAAGIDGLGCVVHYRTAAGGYVPREFGMRFGRAARRGARRAWVLTYNVMGAVSRPREDGTVETLPPVLGVRAVCVLPGTRRARDQTVARLEAVLRERGLRGRPETSARAPLERAAGYAWAGLRGALRWLGPRPLSAQECLERNRHNECTAWSVEPIRVVAPGTPINVTCPAGFDFEYSSGNCVRTGFDPVAPVWPGNTGNSGGASPPPPPPPDPPACDPVPTRMFEEYAEYGILDKPSGCEAFATSGGSAHFKWKELNGGWADGNPHTDWGWVQSALTDGLEATRTNYGDQPIRVTSGYRSPHGNASIPGADPQSKHQSGRAADMYSVNRPWTEDEFRKLREAAETAGGVPWAPDGYYTYADRHLHITY